MSKKFLSSVASALSEFTRKETLDSANRWKCSGCKKHVCALKQLTVFRPPLTLCIQLKRFAYGGGYANFGGGLGYGHYGGKGMGMIGRGGSKITKSIDFPAQLNLPLSDGRKCDYHLTGIVVHIGGSASSGHYTAFVKKPDSHNKSSQWYHMDDSFVEPVSEKTVLRQKDAYILFYCRKEVKIEYPSPPPRSSMSADEAREHGTARARARANSLDRGLRELSMKTVISPARPSDTITTGKADKEPGAPTSLSEPSSMSEASEPSETKPRITTMRSTSNKKASQRSSELVAEIESESAERISSSESSSSSEERDSEASTSREMTDFATKCASYEPTYDDACKTDSETSSDSVESSSSSDSDDASDSHKGKSLNSESANSSDTSNSEEDGKKENPINPLEKVNSETNPSESFLSDIDAASSHKDNISDTSVPTRTTSSDSPDSSDDDDDHGDNETESEKRAKDQALMHHASAMPCMPDAKRSEQTKAIQKTRVVLDRGGMRGKLEVMLGPRHGAKAWKPKTNVANIKDEEHELLGSIRVGKWDDNGDDDDALHSGQRKNALKQLEKHDRSRKRNMYLDRWDSMLDEGRVSLYWRTYQLLATISHL